jgi:hypothetical protein
MMGCSLVHRARSMLERVIGALLREPGIRGRGGKGREAVGLSGRRWRAFLGRGRWTVQQTPTSKARQIREGPATGLRLLASKSERRRHYGSRRQFIVGRLPSIVLS